MAIEKNVQNFNLAYFGMADKRQGIVHIIGPEQGFTVPGATCVCGDSHTATHGAFGALAFGIGTSEVEHVLATSTLTQIKAKNMLVSVEGELGAGVTSKDIILHICRCISQTERAQLRHRTLPLQIVLTPRVPARRKSSSCSTWLPRPSAPPSSASSASVHHFKHD